MDSIIMAIVLCQIHVQAIEYINSEQVCGSIVIIFINYCSFKKEAVVDG